MPCRASVQCARRAAPPPRAGAPREPTAWILRAAGVASRPGSRRPDGAHRQPPGDERPLRCPTARTSGGPPGDGETADDAPSFLEHAAVSFSRALRRMFPSDCIDAALASFKPLWHVWRSPPRDVHRRLPAPRRHATPHRPLRGARRRRLNRPCKAGPRPVPPSLCAPRLLARPVAWRSRTRHA